MEETNSCKAAFEDASVVEEGPPRPAAMLSDIVRALGMTDSQLREFVRYSRKYRHRDAPKKGLGTRHLSAPEPALMEVLHKLDASAIFEALPIHDAAHGFVRGRSIVTHAAVHTDATTLVTVDLEDWFDTIDTARIATALQGAGWTEEAARVVSRLCTDDGRLPQGAPTSPRLANFVARHLDRQLALLARRFGFAYTRYADDLTFSSREGRSRGAVQRFLRQVERLCKGEHFRIRWDKVKVTHHWTRMEVAGLVLNPEDGAPPVRVSREYIRRVASAIYNYQRGRAEWTREQIVSAISFVSMVNKAQGEKLKKRLEDAEAQQG